MSKYVSRSPEMLKDIRERATKALYRAGFATEGRAKRKARYLTGNLRRSIHTKVVDERGAVLDGKGTDENGQGTPQYPATGMLSAYVGTNTGYGKWVEVKTEAFLAPALDGAKADLERELKNMGLNK